MAGITIAEVIADFFTYAPKIAAFEAGTAVTLAVPSASYDLPIPDVGNVKVTESGTTVTIQKG